MTTTKNTVLHSSLLDFAVPVVQDFLALFGGQRVMIPTIERWRAVDDRRYVRGFLETPVWMLGDEAKAFRARSTGPAYDSAVAAVEADPVLKPLRGKYWGPPPESIHVEPADVILRATHHLLLHAEQSGRFDPAELGNELRSFLRIFEKAHTFHVTGAPLLGFAAAAPFKLRVGHAELSVDIAPPELIAMCLGRGYLHPWPGNGADVTFPEPLWMLSHRAQISMDHMENMRRYDHEAQPDDLLVSAIHAVRLFTDQPLVAPLLVRYDEPLPGAIGMSELGRQPFMGVVATTTRLDREDTAQLAGFLEAAQTDRLRTAVRRFGLAMDRALADDQLVDLVIAAEALFLHEMGKPEEKGELTYRLALRAALTATLSGRSAKDTFDLFRSAYNFRSAVVHGGKKSLRHLLKGNATEERAFLESLRGSLRASILYLAENNIDWNTRIVDAVQALRPTSEPS